MINLNIQVKTAHVCQINVVIRMFHEPFTVAFIVKPEIVELTWVKLLELLFCCDIFGFLLSKEDVLFIELLHIQVVSLFLHLSALSLLLITRTIIFVLLH